MLFKNDLITSSVLATIVSILVVVNTNFTQQDNKHNMLVVFAKSFAISFVICYGLLFFLNDTQGRDVVSNIIKDDPDF